MKNPYKEFSNINPQRATRTAPGNYDRRINNQVWHALMCACLAGGEYQVVMTVIDRTWGYGKLSAQISLKNFENATNLTRQGIIKALKRVEQRHIVVCHRDGTRETEYLFNKHYDTWTTPTSKPGFTSYGEEAPEEEEAALVNNGLPASEQELTSEKAALVNESLPNKSTGVYQSSEQGLTSTSKQAEPTTEPVNIYIKENYKENIYIVLFNHWNSLNVIKHRALTDKMRGVLNSALKNYSDKELKQAMTNYAEILHGTDYYWSHPWTLEQFIHRGLDRFIDIEIARQSFRVKENGYGQSRTAKAQPRLKPITYIDGSGPAGPDDED